MLPSPPAFVKFSNSLTMPGRGALLRLTSTAVMAITGFTGPKGRKKTIMLLPAQLSWQSPRAQTGFTGPKGRKKTIMLLPAQLSWRSPRAQTGFTGPRAQKKISKLIQAQLSWRSPCAQTGFTGPRAEKKIILLIHQHSCHGDHHVLKPVLHVLGQNKDY
jgi:hypothetical protein